ncbi:carbon-nitrogen hydrolase family protein [Umezawaea endophytica]|uniref:Carbon-nitrogen hydrolase family protein n=1 Tax=Umezawaea endophytica TaxID=1654476 RepID=A0A9X2VHT9_9PSEU|nr:carbon-nitrogen hydrolase family protein [Umezawaea endophytica]MCS7476920.1 carbon-nitrogen hydrolase family protein [Umezawaea endophytica]
MPETKHVRLAVAQTVLREGPRDDTELRDSGSDVRRLMREAREAGATLVHFPESATCLPDKYRLCGGEPAESGPANWELFSWDALDRELADIAALAGELGLWTVLGSTHRLTPPNRPHNSLYVISDRGRLVTRYDERLLSNTKINHLYTPETGTRTFTVGGLRFGLLLGMEVHFPELFLEQERLDVDCVLFSTHDDDEPSAAEARGHAATNSFWVSYAAPARGATSGVISPTGHWEARCSGSGKPELAIVDLDGGQENLARRWRRTARSGIYEPHTVRNDSRSDNLHAF